MQANIALNRALNKNLGNTILHCVPHGWGTDLGPLPAPADVLIMSDVVYDPIMYAPLVTTLSRFIGPQTECIMAHRHRNPVDGQFFDMLREAGFGIRDIPHTIPEHLHRSCADVRLLGIFSLDASCS
jgi:predicted nicotinamide N-methyase